MNLQLLPPWAGLWHHRRGLVASSSIHPRIVWTSIFFTILQTRCTLVRNSVKWGCISYLSLLRGAKDNFSLLGYALEALEWEIRSDCWDACVLHTHALRPVLWGFWIPRLTYGLVDTVLRRWEGLGGFCPQLVVRQIQVVWWIAGWQWRLLGQRHWFWVPNSTTPRWVVLAIHWLSQSGCVFCAAWSSWCSICVGSWPTFAVWCNTPKMPTSDSATILLLHWYVQALPKWQVACRDDRPE